MEEGSLTYILGGQTIAYVQHATECSGLVKDLWPIWPVPDHANGTTKVKTLTIVF